MRWMSVLALLLALSLPTRPADACMAIGHDGPIRIHGEEALVVWDEAAHTEHFIRRADFRGVSRDFGFLVPTPSRPTITDVDDGVFGRLFDLYGLVVVARSAGADGLCTRGLGSGGDVHVVEQLRVAGMQATVLEATSASALDAWLGEHGYPSSPEIAAWLGPYVTQRWYVTAFRVDPGEHAGRAFGTRAVRMSFATERPFFPYSEPQLAGATPRPFRVSVVAPHRMDALLGETPWRVHAGYANHPRPLARALAPVLPEGTSLEGAWLTTFDERRSLRGTDDLFFVPAEHDTRVRSRITTAIRP